MSAVIAATLPRASASLSTSSRISVRFAGQLRREVVELGAADARAEAEGGRHAGLPRQHGEGLERRLQLLDLARVLFDPAEPGLDGGPGVLDGTVVVARRRETSLSSSNGSPSTRWRNRSTRRSVASSVFAALLLGVVHGDRLPDLLAEGLEARDRLGHLSEGRRGRRPSGREWSWRRGGPPWPCSAATASGSRVLRGAGEERESGKGNGHERGPGTGSSTRCRTHGH